MIDYPALRARLAELAATDMSDRARRAAAFAALSAETVAEEGPVEVLAVVRKLIELGVMDDIQTSGMPAAVTAAGMLRTLRDYGETHVDLREGSPDRAILDALVPTHLTAAERDAVVALGVTLRPRWPGLREGHLQNAAAMTAREA